MGPLHRHLNIQEVFKHLFTTKFTGCSKQYYFAMFPLRSQMVSLDQIDLSGQADFGNVQSVSDRV